jgi:hypothetical protein
MATARARVLGGFRRLDGHLSIGIAAGIPQPPWCPQRPTNGRRGGERYPAKI